MRRAGGAAPAMAWTGAKEALDNGNHRRCASAAVLTDATARRCASAAAPHRSANLHHQRQRSSPWIRRRGREGGRQSEGAAGGGVEEVAGSLGRPRGKEARARRGNGDKQLAARRRRPEVGDGGGRGGQILICEFELLN